MLLDKYKRDYKRKSDNPQSNKTLYIGLAIGILLCALMWYYSQ